MKHIIIVLIINLCIFQALCPKEVSAIDLSVPQYDQNNFNDPYISDYDCAPVAVGMIIGYWAQNGYPNLIVNPGNFPNSSLGDFSQNAANIRSMVQVFCDYLEWSYGYLQQNNGVPPYDLSHKTRLGISELDAYYQFAVTQKFFDDTAGDRSAFYDNVKSQIDTGAPILLYILPKLKYWGDIAKTDGPYIFNENANFAHYAVITGYTGRTIHLNWGMPNKLTVYVDADDLGYAGINGGTMFALYYILLENDLDVGLFGDGWHWEYEKINGVYVQSETYNNPSQPFVDTFIESGGESVLGLPWDNGGTENVHAFPNETTEGALYVQDFLYDNNIWYLLVYNDALRKVYPLHGQILNFWIAYSGYFLYGAPMEAEHNEVDSSGRAIVVQRFKKGETVSYIGYCSEEVWAGEYTFENGQYVPNYYVQTSGADPQIDNIISMKSVPNLICGGDDAFAYLGSNPTTEQPVVSIINPLNGAETGNIVFLNSNARPKFITILPDMNGNGYSEIHVTAYDVTNLGKLIEIRDSLTGAIIQ